MQFRNVLLAYIVLRPVIAAFYDVYPVPGMRITDFAGFLFIVFSVFVIMNAQTRVRPPLSGPMKLLIYWVIISSIMHIAMYDMSPYVVSKDVFKILNGSAAFFLYPLLFKSREDVILLWVAYIVSTIYPAAQAIMQFTGIMNLNTSITESGVVLYQGVYGNNGYFAFSALMGSIVVIGLSGVVQKKIFKRLLFVAFIIFLFISTLTVSRNVFVNMIIVAAVFLFSKVQMGKKLALVVPVMILLSILSTSLFQSQYDSIVSRSRYEFEILEGERDISQGMHGRIERWEDGVQLYLSDYNIIENIIGTDIYIGPHGDYFFWLLYFGILGLIVYMSLIMRIVGKVLVDTQGDKFAALFRYVSLASILVWVSTAIVTNPSMMPDYSYFILGNISIYMTHFMSGTSANTKNSIENISSVPTLVE
jgi:O-antigen ligase